MVLSRPKDYRMPFSKERTQLIKTKLKERLEDDTLNKWKREFLANMSDLFDRFGESTRLSDAQYRKLHALLKLEKAVPQRTQLDRDNPQPSPSPKPASTKPETRVRKRRPVPSSRGFRPRIVPSPYRAIRRA